MPRPRLLATTMFAVAAFPLVLLTGDLQAVPALAPIAIPAAVAVAGVLIWALCRPRANPDDRLSTWIADLSPALAVAATTVAAVCWWALQTGAYALAGFLVYEHLPAAMYPVPLVGLLASATVLGWWPWRTGNWRLGWLSAAAVITFTLTAADHLATDKAPVGWHGPGWLMSALIGAALLLVVLAGSLAHPHGGRDLRRRTLAETTTITAAALLASGFGYTVLDMYARLGSGPLGHGPLPDGTIVGAGPAGFEISEPALRALDHAVGYNLLAGVADVGRWPIMAGILAAIVLFGRAMTDQLDALRRVFSGSTDPKPHPSRGARLVHLAAAAAGLAAVATHQPMTACYIAFAAGGLGLAFIVAFAGIGYAQHLYYESEVLPSAGVCVAVAIVAAVPALFLTALLPDLFAWTWTTTALWTVAGLYPATIGAALAAAALGLRHFRPSTYGKARFTLPGAATDPHRELADPRPFGSTIRDGQTRPVGDRVALTEQPQ